MVDFGGRRRRFCGGDPEELIDLVDTINDPGVGMCIDIGHANNSGIYVPDFIRMAGSRLKCTHVNDNLADKDTHLPPFMGSVDWRGVMSALREIGYDGDFSYEINPQRFPAETVDVWLRFLHDLGQRLLQM
jgi:sugar phosphate isomerase/epimerase